MAQLVAARAAKEDDMTTTLPADLHAAYEWIEAAGEWDDALANAETYAADAAANAVQHDIDDVTEASLLEAIVWRRAHPRAR